MSQFLCMDNKRNIPTTQIPRSAAAGWVVSLTYVVANFSCMLFFRRQNGFTARCRKTGSCATKCAISEKCCLPIVGSYSSTKLKNTKPQLRREFCKFSGLRIQSRVCRKQHLTIVHRRETSTLKRYRSRGIIESHTPRRVGKSSLAPRQMKQECYA